LLVVVLVPAAAFIAVKLLSGPVSTGTGEQPTAPVITAEPTTQPTEPATETPGETLTPPPEEPPTTEPVPGEMTNFAIPITVMNDVSDAYEGTRDQLAARTVAQLTTAGFTAASASGEHVENGRATSKVYYGSAEASGTAEAVADTIGISAGQVEMDAVRAASAIVVSLGDDFREP